MELTEERKGLYVQVLRIAKNYINDGQNVSLLNAVSRVRVAAATPPMRQACDDIARHIVTLLNGNTSLEEWLFFDKGIDINEDCDEPPCDVTDIDYRLQQTNLRWADYLSEHLTDIMPEAKAQYTVIPDPNKPPEPPPAPEPTVDDDMLEILGEKPAAKPKAARSPKAKADFDLDDIV